MKTITQGLRTLVRALIVFVVFTAIAATIIIQTSGDDEFQYSKEKSLIVNDITGMNPVTVGHTISPQTTPEIIDAIRNSSGPISIGGGRYSMGGQTAYENSLHIDMRNFNKIVNFDKAQKTITVQAGISWRDIQDYIDPHDLSIRIMQTYANFTVGGSLSVNVHGRYIGEGPLIKSVESLKVVLADGQLVNADRNNNSDIFYGVIGGYGGLGVITEATLHLTDNVKIERRVTRISSKEYPEHFSRNIRDNPNVVFHNGDLYPPDYEEVLDVSWFKTDKPLTIEDRLRDRDTEYYWMPRTAAFVANYDIGKFIRKNIIDPVYYQSDRVVWRNWEASYDVRELEPDSRTETTYVLREYFVPVEKFNEFLPLMKDIFVRNKANIINVSIRHAHAEPGNLLSWARNEVFAFVVYYQQGTDETSRAAVKKWSIEMIDAIIAMGGTYYLPYQIFASPEQFKAAYPRSPEFFALKNRLDPDNRFTNQLWKKHYPSSRKTFDDKKLSIKNYYRSEEQTVLTIPEWYLVFNPLEYAEYLEAGNNPSDFPFFESLDEYWSLYDRVVKISRIYKVDNSEYMTMLQVIGVSTTIEYMFKSFYENTIGRFTRWTANGENTQEDEIITQAQRAYSNLIFHEAWYVFDFSSWVHRIWSETEFFGKNFIRKTERKLFFTLEFVFKTLYAKLIGFASQTAYEHGDGLIYLVANLPSSLAADMPDNVKIHLQEKDKYIISIPKWGAFTETLPTLILKGAVIDDISGNQKIAVTYITPEDQDIESITMEKLFDSRIVTRNGYLRKAVIINVSLLGQFLENLKSRGFQLEHIYDY